MKHFSEKDIGFLQIYEPSILNNSLNYYNIMLNFVNAKGRNINEIRIISNNYDVMMENIKDMVSKYYVVIICGGIGFTRYDTLPECLGRIFNQEMKSNDIAKAKIHKHFHECDINKLKKSFALPKGAVPIDIEDEPLIGFRVGNVFALPAVENFRKFAKVTSSLLQESYAKYITKAPFYEKNLQKILEIMNENDHIKFHIQNENNAYFLYIFTNSIEDKERIVDILEEDGVIADDVFCS